MRRKTLAAVSAMVPSLLLASGAAAQGVTDKFGGSHVAGFTSAGKQNGFAATAANAGVRWAKESFAWYNMETSPGVYSFVNQDRFINADFNNGLEIMVEIGFTPSFYSPQPGPAHFLYPPTSTAGLNAWAAYVTACVNRYKDRVKVWQVWTNMDDALFWPLFPGGVSEYRNVLLRAHAAIKAADPTATVVTASMDPSFLNRMLDLGTTQFDVIGVHNYGEPYAPEVSTLFALRLAAVRDVSQRRAGGKPLIVSEYGWPSAPGAPTGVSESFQAHYMIRANLLHGVQPDVLRTFWTDFQDQPVGGAWTPTAPEDNFGMLLKAEVLGDAPKLSVNANRAMSAALSGATFVGRREPTRAGILFTEGFETGRVYSDPFLAGGATGSATRTSAVAHTGSFSMRFDYTMTQAVNATVAIAPEPNFSIPVPGAPRRIRFWARGTGGPPPMLTVGFTDVNGELFEVILGLVAGTDWREYSYTLDAVPGTSVLGTGNQDNVIQYPINFTGIGLHIWTVSSPVGPGTLWVDDLVFEGGPTVFDLEFKRAGETVHALWALDNTYSVRIPTTATATYRDFTNATFPFAPSNGAVTVPVGVAPVMLTIPAAAPTFTDVPFNNAVWAFVESVFRSGVTSGCSNAPPQYCPTFSVTRGQMAVFLVRAKHGPAFVPPPATGRFADVPANSPFAPFIEQVHTDGITGGCATAPLRYCPDFGVTREQMAVFLLRSLHGSLYAPPAATGVFADVPSNSPFAPWVEQIHRQGITGGCATGPLRYCPTTVVARAQMAVFLQATFGFPLP